jgi:hypothetical protein
MKTIDITEENAATGFTKRVLLSLLTDVAEAAENLRAIEVKITAIAKEHGIEPVTP